jgi:hypothetical protein
MNGRPELGHALAVLDPIHVRMGYGAQATQGKWMPGHISGVDWYQRGPPRCKAAFSTLVLDRLDAQIHCDHHENRIVAHQRAEGWESISVAQAHRHDVHPNARTRTHLTQHRARARSHTH